MLGLKPLQFEFHGVRLPEFSLTKEDRELLEVEGDESEPILRAICREGWKKKVAKGLIAKNDRSYIDRVNYELSVLKETQFDSYILIVWDFINFCNKNNIELGPGRGSGAGSLVNYLAGITDVDPIKNELFFERFVSKSRAKVTKVDGVSYYDGDLLADIDVDVAYDKRYILIDYLKNKYPNRVCKLPTFSTFQTKVLITDLCKVVLDYSPEEAKEVSDLIPKAFGKNFELDAAIDEEPRFKEFCEKNPKVLNIAYKLYNLPRAVSVHASALLVTHENVDDFIPGHFDADGELVSSFDMYQATKHALKVDVLGLKTVTLINRVCNKAGIVPENIPSDSYEEIYKYLEHLETPLELFQISGDGVLKVVNRVKPKNLNQLSDVTSLARPGAMKYIDNYVDRIPPTKDEKILSIIDETNYVIVYQEQLIKLGKEVFGLTSDEAETVRRVVSKKKHDQMPKWEEVVRKNAERLGVSKEAADFFWHVLDASKDYSFNKCLSPDTIVETENGYKIMAEVNIGDKIKAFNIDLKKNHFVTVKNVYDNQVELYEVELDDGRIIKCSLDHKFVCEDFNKYTLSEILQKKLKILTD